VAYQTGSSNVCMLWLGGQAAGQVSQGTCPAARLWQSHLYGNRCLAQ
jgi:hypothetical protein